MLRDYQVDQIGRGYQAYKDGARGVLFQGSTGSGKTHMAAEGIIAPTVAHGRKVIFLADLEEIILDTTARIARQGLHVGAILDGRALDPTAPVQVASQQTLISWQKRGISLPPCDRVIVDECHGVAARTMRDLLGALRERGALLAGLTGTPARGDGQPLDEFDALVCGPQPGELVRAGALVPCEVVAPLGLLDGCAMDPVEAVQAYASERRAIVFAPHNAEAQRIAAELSALGQPTMAVLDSTPRRIRRQVRARLALWTTDRAHPDALQHLVTTRALQKGFDAPCLDVCVLTSECSIVSFLQDIGRVLRPSPETGKADALVVDLRGASLIHGLPLWDRAWSLEGGQGRLLTGDEIPNLRRCQECRALFPPRTVCPRCGCTNLIDPRPLRVQRAEMFAASTVPLEIRARGYLAGTERAMVRRGMRPEKAVVVARAKAPQWVRDALADEGILTVQRNQTAQGSRGGALLGIVGARLVYEIERAHGLRPGLIIERNPIMAATTRSGSDVLTGIGGKGAPDLYMECAGPGGLRVALWVECKAGTGELNDDQRLWHARASNLGRHVITARSVDDVTRALECLESGRACDLEVSVGEPARALNVIAGPWLKAAQPSLRDRTADIFERVLPARWAGFSAREGQTALTGAIATTIDAGGVLLAEGPCGTGKGLAYLVPAILEADRTGKTVVVVTASIALQEQLIQKDLPALAAALAGELRTPLTFALLKGRSNYLCLNTLADPPPYLSREESAELYAVDQWARTTTTGDRLELPMIVRDGTWSLRSTTTDDCLRDGCDFYDDCFARAAKARAEGVRVLVINYHLLFAHVAVKAETGADMVIPKTAGFDSKLAWDTVLCDEAHEAGDIAREFLGCTMSEGMVRKVAAWLREDAKACVGDVVAERLTLAADLDRESAALWRDMVDRVPRPLGLKGQPKEGDRTQRLREGLPAEDLHGLVVRAGKVASALHASLAKHGSELEKDDRKVMRRAENCARRAKRIASWLDASVCPAEAPQTVMWIEVREVGKRREERATLHGRLLDVGTVLRDELFGRSRAVVLTSATLTTGGTPQLGAVLPAETSDSWSWARAQVGLPGSTPALAVASPFDFAAQAVLCLPSGRNALPSPKDHREAFDAAVCDVMARVSRVAGGRTLGLFTSRRMAERAAAHLRTLGLPWPVLCQGEQPRPYLLAAMRATPSILCGTASLWTGVDLPEESVVAVVVDKLPFTPPDDPVMQALGELAAYRTGDRMAGFTQESLPRATLEVRQGAGRLIRSDRDWGAVVLCDSRLTTARYGRGVIASLGMPAQVHSVEALEAWFRARAMRAQTGGAA